LRGWGGKKRKIGILVSEKKGRNPDHIGKRGRESLLQRMKKKKKLHALE